MSYTFFANLFGQKLLYSTINSHRSAIFTYHNLIEIMLIVQHPKVCTLMGEIFNINPLKFVPIWNVEQFLTDIRGLPDNTGLSDRTLPLKLMVFLFLTSPERYHKIYYLYISYMIKTSSSDNFHFAKLHKAGKRRNHYHFWKSMNIIWIISLLL